MITDWIGLHSVLLPLLIDNDTRHHSGQNVVDSRGAAEWVCNKFWPLWSRVFLSIRLYTTLHHSRFVFYHNIKVTKSLSWQLKTTTRIWNCTRCIMQMSYLYASDFPFKNFCKLAQHTETIRKNVWEKSNDAFSCSISVQTTINHISIFTFYFFMTISTSKKMFSFRARAEKGIARHIDTNRVVGTW